MYTYKYMHNDVMAVTAGRAAVAGVYFNRRASMDTVVDR